MRNNLPAFLAIDSTTCDIYRKVIDVDHAFGSPAGEFTVIATGVICAFDRSMSINRQYGGGREVSIQGETDHESFKLFVLPTADLLTGDKVIVGVLEYKVNDVINYPTHKEGMLSLWK
jgi:hypothetical protein